MPIKVKKTKKIGKKAKENLKTPTVGKKSSINTREGAKIKEEKNKIFKEIIIESGIDIEILKLLKEQDIQQNYLDIGYSEKHKVWWYGFLLGRKPAIILSDGRILRNTQEKIKDKTIGENQIKEIFHYMGYLGNIAPIISKKTVERYYTHNKKEKMINPIKVYKELKDKFLYYLDFGDQKEIADVLSCWVIGTYCYPLFYWFPHILINAPRESGKTKCLKIIQYSAFRGFDIGGSSIMPSTIFRVIEGNRGTMVIDEFEQTDKETLRIVNQILNSACSKGSQVIRNEQFGRKWFPKPFQIFGPKATANISGINPTSLTRYIFFKWLKTNSEQGKRKVEREKDRESFETIKEDLHILILENWQKIKEIYDNLDLPELKNRLEDNWLPLFAIAEFVDENDTNIEEEKLNVSKQLKKYLEDYQELQIDTSDNTEDFFLALIEYVSDEQDYYSPKQIAEFQEIKELLSYLKSPPHWIGKTLKLFKFRQVHKNNQRKYLLSKKNVSNILNTYYKQSVTLGDISYITSVGEPLENNNNNINNNGTNIMSPNVINISNVDNVINVSVSEEQLNLFEKEIEEDKDTIKDTLRKKKQEVKEIYQRSKDTVAHETLVKTISNYIELPISEVELIVKEANSNYGS